MLIAGGRNKGLDLTPMAEAGDRMRAVVAIGEAAPEVAAAFARALRPGRPRRARWTRQSRRRAGLAAPGDAVLLSPGCASFDWYSGYAERGDDFARAVHELQADGAHDGDHDTMSAAGRGRWSRPSSTRAPPPGGDGTNGPARRRRGRRRRRSFYVLLVAIVAILVACSGSSWCCRRRRSSPCTTDGSAWTYFRRQAMWTVLGVVALLVACRMPYHFWRPLVPPGC